MLNVAIFSETNMNNRHSRILHYESLRLEAQMQDLNAQLNDDLIPLRRRNKILEDENKVLERRNRSLRKDANTWHCRVISYTAKAKIDDEAYRILKVDHENLKFEVKSLKDQLEEANKEIFRLQQEKTRANEKLANIQQKMEAARNEIKALTEERGKLCQKLNESDHTIVDQKTKLHLKDQKIKFQTESFNLLSQVVDRTKSKLN